MVKYEPNIDKYIGEQQLKYLLSTQKWPIDPQKLRYVLYRIILLIIGSAVVPIYIEYIFVYIWLIFSCICFPAATYIAPLASFCSFRFLGLLSLTHVYLRYRLSAIACRQPLVEYASLYLIREITATRRQKEPSKSGNSTPYLSASCTIVHEICIQCIKQLPIDRL